MIFTADGTLLTHPALPKLDWDDDRAGIHGIALATIHDGATVLECACGHKTTPAASEDAFTALAVHALDTLTPDELLRLTAAAELRAATGTETDADRAVRAELERLAEGLAITPSQRDGWACINCARSGGLDVAMVPVRSIKIGPGALWTLYSCPSCDTA
jgi:hypothetical protein